MVVRYSLHNDSVKNSEVCHRHYMCDSLDEIKDPIEVYKTMRIYNKVATRMSIDIVTQRYSNPAYSDLIHICDVKVKILEESVK